MATKANSVVTDALEDLIVQADEAKIEQSEAMAVIRALNDMMFSWAAQGIDLGYTEISDMGDILTVPAGAIRGIKANLAIEIAPKYDVMITPAMQKKAYEGKMVCVDLAVDMSGSEFPPTLPQGSGNIETFYPDQEATILTETGGSIALEEDTEND